VEKRMTRWRRIVLESSQQSRRAKLPEVAWPIDFPAALKSESGTRLILDESAPEAASLMRLAPPTSPARLRCSSDRKADGTETERTGEGRPVGPRFRSGPQILRAGNGRDRCMAILNAAYY